MNKFISILLLLLIFIGISNAAEKGRPAHSKPLPKEIKVLRCDTAPVIDGTGNDLCWKKIEPITDFVYPWRNDKPEKTSLKICYDEKNLYLFFEAEDRTPVFKKKQKIEMDIAEEDRVEVYFAADRAMKLYYSIEMSPTGLPLDYKCSFHRKFDMSWQMPQLVLKGKIDPSKGYSVEAAYSLDELRKMGVLKENNRILTGFYRADFNRDASGKIIERWISWIDPQRKEEDFHIPETLGELILTR